jgi:hypothetical protein
MRLACGYLIYQKRITHRHVLGIVELDLPLTVVWKRIIDRASPSASCSTHVAEDIAVEWQVVFILIILVITPARERLPSLAGGSDGMMQWGSRLA